MKAIRNIVFGIVDLQLFADVTNATTSPGLSAENKTFYDKVLIKEAGPNLVHQQFGQKRPVPKNEGKTINFRKFASLPKALTPLTEGVTPDGNALAVSTIEATVSQYGDFTRLTDFLELTAIDDVIAETVELCGKQAGATLDTIVRDIINAGTNVSYAPKVSGSTVTPVTHRYELDSSAKLTADVVKRTVAKLRAQNAPTINGDYVAVAHPYSMYDLMCDPEWIDAHKYAQPENLYRGEVGKIGGCRFVESSEAKIIRGDDLASNSRTLAVNGSVSASRTIAFDGGTVASNALKNRYVIIGSVCAKVKSNTASQIVLADDAPTVTCDNDTVIYPGEGGKEGETVYCTLMFGKNAYGTTEIEGGGLQTIIKQKGSGGSSDPLEQRSTIGWKASLAAEILIPNYLVRIEHGGSFNTQESN